MEFTVNTLIKEPCPVISVLLTSGMCKVTDQLALEIEYEQNLSEALLEYNL